MPSFQIPPQLNQGRVRLRKHTFADAEALFLAIDGDRTRLSRYLPWPDTIQDLEDEIAYIRMTHERWESHELFSFGIHDQATDQFLGCMGVHAVAWKHRRCEIGYWLLSDEEGKGYVTEALAALEKALFNVGFHRLEIHCSSDNLRSISVPERNGYHLDGVLRQALHEEGGFSDVRIYSKLSTD